LRGRGGVALLDADVDPSALLEGAQCPIDGGHARAATDPAPLGAQPLADVVGARGPPRQQAEERVVRHRVLRSEGSVVGKGSRLAWLGSAPARTLPRVLAGVGGGAMGGGWAAAAAGGWPGVGGGGGGGGEGGGGSGGGGSGGGCWPGRAPGLAPGPAVAGSPGGGGGWEQLAT